MTARPTHTVIQMSDPHILEPGQLLHGTVDTAATLTAALAQLEGSGLRPDAIILSGDLTDTGSPAAYARLRAIVEPVARRLGSPVLYGAGNHDDRDALRAAIPRLGGDEHPDAGDGGRTDHEAPGRPIHYARHLGGLRIAVLDSSVPGHPHGELGSDQLDWLTDLLREPAPDGTIVVVHHPPARSANAIMELISLRDDERLGAVIANRDVKIVLAGHLHYSSASAVGGVPVWVSGATAYLLDPLSPDPSRGLGGSQFTRVDVYPRGAVAATVPVPSGAVVHELSLANFERYLDLLGDHGDH
ncbi:MAG: metallophosphoesterase [Frankia sp.]